MEDFSNYNPEDNDLEGFGESIVELVNFLNARYDALEAEAVKAVELIEKLGDEVSDDTFVGAHEIDGNDGTLVSVIEISPAMLFAWVDAQREVIKAALRSYSGAPDGPAAEAWMRVDILCAMAVAFVDHEDYNPEWAESL